MLERNIYDTDDKFGFDSQKEMINQIDTLSNNCNKSLNKLV